MPVTPLRAVELGSLGAAVTLTATLFLPAAADPVNVVKLVVLLVCALACFIAAAVGVVRARELSAPSGAFLPALGVFLVALSMAAAASPSGTTAALGTPGRLSGLVLYAACVVLAVSTLRGGRAGLSVVEAAVGLAGLFTAAYGGLQYLGVDPIDWANEFNPIIASLGNPNFAAAYLGVCFPVVLTLALRPDWPSWLRIGAAVSALGMLAVALLSSAVQGPLAAAAGCTVVALVWILDRPDASIRRRMLFGLGGSASTGLAALLAGATGAGPAASIFGTSNFETRQWYWSAALDMWRREPILGVGIDHYGRNWGVSRPMENVTALGGGDFTDAAHSVPLHLLATGGLVVALAYLGLLLVTGLALVRGLRLLRGGDRLRLGGLGGGWIAYQVQSMVSIDQVPLVVLNFVLSAAVVVASGSAPVTLLRLPGALPPAPERAAARRRAASIAPRVRATTPGDLAWFAAIGTAGLVGLWFALIPLRADVAAQSGDRALQQGRGDASLAAYDRAIELLPGRSAYWARKAGLLMNARPDAALDAYDGAIRADPSNGSALLNAGALAEAQGELDRARAYLSRAVDVDPFNPSTVTAAATFELRHGGAAAAKDLLETAVARTPAQAALWTPLGDARQVLGDRVGAMEAYERALALDPSIAKATEELTKLRS